MTSHHQGQEWGTASFLLIPIDFFCFCVARGGGYGAQALGDLFFLIDVFNAYILILSSFFAKARC